MKKDKKTENKEIIKLNSDYFTCGAKSESFKDIMSTPKLKINNSSEKKLSAEKEHIRKI